MIAKSLSFSRNTEYNYLTTTLLYRNNSSIPPLLPSVWFYRVSTIGWQWLWPLFMLGDLKRCLQPAMRL